jgi:hypothetical protein
MAIANPRVCTLQNTTAVANPRVYTLQNAMAVANPRVCTLQNTTAVANPTQKSVPVLNLQNLVLLQPPTRFRESPKLQTAS